MRVMGVDPGTLRMGVGVVDSISGELTTPFHGCLSPKRSDPIEQRLAYLLQELEDVIGKVSPDSVAVEEPFVSNVIISERALIILAVIFGIVLIVGLKIKNR